MFVYDKAYTEVKNKYIVPLTKYGVQYNSLRKNNIKEILATKFTSVAINEDKSYLFSFAEEDLLKGLTGDILLFYLRYILQRHDAECIDGVKLSPNWNIVTNYYEAFFAASLLLRLMNRGNIFLDVSKKNEVERLVAYSVGYPIALDSNLFYEIVFWGGQYKLKIQKGDANTHELVWKKMAIVIDELISLSRPQSDEITLLKSIREINNQLQITYPSKIRNKVNYQPLYGLETIERKLFSMNRNISWVDYLLKYDSISWDNENSVVNVLFCYTKYMEYFCDNLIAEYYMIKGNQNGVLKKYREFIGEPYRDLEITYCCDITKL